MAGLFGLYAPGGRLPRGHLKAFLSDMATAFDEPAWRITTRVKEGLALGRVHYAAEEPGPLGCEHPGAFVASSGNVLLVEGEAAAHWSRNKLDTALLERAANGPESLFSRAIDGRFAAVHLDRRRRRLTLGSDRFALYPLYYCVCEGVLWFATRLAALVPPNRAHLSVDHDAIADYLAHRHFVGNSTFFREIKLLPEGSTVHFAGEEATAHRFWRYHLAERPDETQSGQAGVDALRRAWDRTLDAAARVPGRPGVALSGGLDSRAITAALSRRGKRPVTYTFGDPTCNDIRFATQTARRLGLENRSTTLEQGSYMARDFELVVRRSDGSWPLNHAHLAVLRPLMADSADLLFDGLTGGVLSIGKVTRYKETITPETAVERLSGVYRLYDDDLVRPIAPHARPFAERAAHQLDYYTAGNQRLSSSAAIIFSNAVRQRRFTTHNPRLLEGDKRVLCPFWTTDYANACFRLAPRDRITRGPFVRLNRQAYPELNPVPWTMTGLPITVPMPLTRGFMRLHEGASYANYFIQRATGFAPLGGFQAGFALYFDWVRLNPELRAFVLETLTDPFLDRLPFLDRNAVAAMVHRHMDNVLVNYVDLIGSLLSTVLYFRTVLHW